MKKDMETLINIAEGVSADVKEMKNELHTTNKIAVSVSFVNILTLICIVWLSW